MPEDALQVLSRSIVGGSRPVDVPPALRDPPRDLTIMLADSDFVSFAGPFDATAKRVVGIRGSHLPPMNLPNVARNVIAHELGHAIGLATTTIQPSSCADAQRHADLVSFGRTSRGCFP
jgi:hypothetical protein